MTAIAEGPAAAFCLSVLSHSVSDESALNHPPLLQFVQYSRFEGVDYPARKVEPGAKNLFGFRSDGFVVHRVRQILKDFRPEEAQGAFSDSLVGLVSDQANQAFHAAEKEGVIAFAPRADAEEALAQLVAMQVRVLVTMAWTCWVNRASDAPLPTPDFDARYASLVECVIKTLDPSKMGVFDGIFDESRNPASPKGELYIVCEPYAAPQGGHLQYVGRMLGAAAGRTARDNGWAVRGISFWRIAYSDVLPRPGRNVRLLIPGGTARWQGAETVAAKLKAWREAGGKMIYVGGDDPLDISGFANFLEVHPDEEIPSSTKWGLCGSGNWRLMSLTWKGVRYPQRRNASFDGFCKPICRVGIRPGEEISEIARFNCGEKSFVAAARRGNCVWVPLYALMPFLYSDDTALNWREMRLDSFASRFFMDLL